MPDAAPINGRAHRLRSGAYEAEVVAVGAALRVLRHHDRDLVVPFGTDVIRPVFRGAILAPWPNRVVDGRYRFDGEDHQLALTEPDRGHALHGLVGWAEFDAVQPGPAQLELVTEIVPQQGYPYRVRVEVGYELDDDGLTTTVTGTNLGARPAPWGTGPHPYLRAGAGRVDDWVLQLPAASVLEVSPDRLAPVGLVDVAAAEHGAYDFRTPRPIGSTEIDHAFTALDRPDGRARVTLATPDGSGVAMTFDDACPWVQVHTADRPDPAEHRVGLAVEPMTCAPDAFNSGLGLVTLPPGGSHRASWRIAALEAPPG